MFLEQQILILERFLKDHVTLKTGLMMLKIQLCHFRNKLHFKCIPIENSTFKIVLFYCIFIKQMQPWPAERQKYLSIQTDLMK